MCGALYIYLVCLVLFLLQIDFYMNKSFDLSLTSSISMVCLSPLLSLSDQMLGEYNHSVLCYEQALQAQPGFEQALRRKHAVLCQQKLEQRLEAQHR